MGLRNPWAWKHLPLSFQWLNSSANSESSLSCVLSTHWKLHCEVWGTVCSLQISCHAALTRRKVMSSRIPLRQSAKMSDQPFHGLYCPPRHCPSHSGRKGDKSNKKWGHSSQDVQLPFWIQIFIPSKCSSIQIFNSTLSISTKTWHTDLDCSYFYEQASISLK